MSHELKEGVKLKSVSGPVDKNGDQIYLRIGDRPMQYRSIVVVEQAGQMGMVPWAKGVTNSGEVTLVNLALMESVILEQGQ
ncbi:MAG: hypothetical protein Q8L60_10865 [Gammaproteobacteria bacterium]|nr:hypothetical protein [Gammaproteobacteria bacterium]MDP2346849.1 hypothetical protein [Gammaproteobacteria bacterium]